MTSVGGNQNIPEKRDLKNKELQSKLGIDKITELTSGKQEDNVMDNATDNKKDEVMFQAGRKGKVYVAEGANIDMDAFSELYDDLDNPLTYAGKEVGIGFIDDYKMELNGRASGKSAFNIDGIRELKVPLKEAIEKTHKDGIDQLFFRVDGKDYVAYGKNIDVDLFVDVAQQNLLSGDPLLLNGKEIAVNYVDDEANTFGEGFNHALDKAQNFNAGLMATSVVLGGATAGLMGVALYPVVAVGTAMAVEGTVGGVKAMFNKPDSKNMDSITEPDLKAPEKK
jgi:hypothetical protein